jgi:hypothetical protein
MSLEVKGVNGTITFDGAFVSIVRSGFLARATIGKGEKRIPVGHISSVQFKPAGLVRGFIQFSLAGGVERRSQFGRQSTGSTWNERWCRAHHLGHHRRASGTMLRRSSSVSPSCIAPER